MVITSESWHINQHLEGKHTVRETWGLLSLSLLVYGDQGNLERLFQVLANKHSSCMWVCIWLQLESQTLA